MSFVEELKRRNVVRVGVAYLAGAWLLVQIVETLFPVFDLPNSAIRMVVIGLAVGFLPALLLAWVFEFNAKGISRDTGAPSGDHRRYDRIVMVLLIVAVTYFVVEKVVEPPPPGFDSSIVVLPFVNMSDDNANEYFADGITEELLNVLAKVDELRVISRSSAFTFKGKDVNAAEVAASLGVSYVLEGSVRKAGDRVRITAQLIDGANDTHIWSDTYDRTLDDIFLIQDEISQHVAEQMEVHILGGAHDTVDPRAYEIMLHARYLVNLYQPENTDTITALLQQGLAIEPDYSELLWLNVRFLSHQSFFDQISKEEAKARKDQIRARLREIDPDSPLLLLGRAAGSSDRQEAADLAVRAYRSAPTNMEVVEGVARFARALGQFDEAVALGEYLLARDPLCGRCYFRQGMAHAEAGNPQASLDAFDKALEYGAGNLDAAYGAAVASLDLGNVDAAENYFEQATDSRSRAKGKLLIAHARGQKESLRGQLAEMEKSLRWDQLIDVYARVGEIDKAFEQIEYGYQRYPKSFITFFSHDSAAFLQGDPRWAELMERLGTTQADIDAISFDIDVPGN